MADFLADGDPYGIRTRISAVNAYSRAETTTYPTIHPSFLACDSKALRPVGEVCALSGDSQLKAVDERDWRECRDKVIYFVGPANGPIKIGRTFKLRQRIRELQVGNPLELFLWRMESGSSLEEVLFHHRFRETHLRGEWFARSSDLVAFLNPLPATPSTTLMEGEGK